MTVSNQDNRKIGPFILGDELGVGGMGVVYRATYEKNGRQVAVKVLSPDVSDNEGAHQRFVRETEILKKLNHPHIIKYYGAGSSKMQKFYAMELLEGGTIDSIIREKGKLTWNEVIDYGLQISKALEHAHNNGIIHRDLKPGNLLLTQDGVLKLSDFGIARDTAATALTQAGKTVGTMNYMAPEQISGKSPITRRTDIYALGCVLFQMLTGRVPFQGNNQAEVLFKHLEDDPPSVLDFTPETPIWLSRLIDEMLAKSPDDRPYDALAVQVKLDEVRTKVKEAEAKLVASADGNVSALTKGYDKKTAAIKKRKRKQKEQQAQVPIYEKTWFLATVLVLGLGMVSWLVISSRSEETLFRKAEVWMSSADAGEWIHAEPNLKTLLSRYPEGARAEQAQSWLDQIGMYRAERWIETNIRLGREPKTEAERLFVEASQYEKFGDRITALQKFEAMPNVIETSEDNQPYLNLARRQADKIKASVGSDTDRSAFISEQLEAADQLFIDGRTIEAQQKWQAIIRLYGNNSEFQVFTDQARKRLAEALASQ